MEKVSVRHKNNNNESRNKRLICFTNQKRRNIGSMWLPRRGNKVVCRKVYDFEIRNQNNTQSLCVGRFLDFKGTEIKSNTQGEKNV